jgi:hypothetical protein
VVSAVTARNNININMGWEYFLIGIGILGCVFLAVCKFLFSKDNENLDVYYTKEVQETEQFLQAKQVFVRDPSEYHDKDKDGVDDILEN